MVGGRPVSLVLDGWQRTASGLELIDGLDIDQNGTGIHGEILPPNRPVTVVCTVKPQSVNATIDGRPVVHWTGTSDHLSLDPDIRTEVGEGLGLVSASQFVVSRLELLPLSRDTQSLATLATATGAGRGPFGRDRPGAGRRDNGRAPGKPSLERSIAQCRPRRASAGIGLRFFRRQKARRHQRPRRGRRVCRRD